MRNITFRRLRGQIMIGSPFRPILIKIQDSYDGNDFCIFSDDDGGAGYKAELKSRVESVIYSEKWNSASRSKSNQTKHSESKHELNFSSHGSNNLSSKGAIQSVCNSKSSLDAIQAQKRLHTVSRDLGLRDQSSNPAKNSSYQRNCDTWVVPLVQMGPVGISVDDHVTQRLWREAREDSRIFLASGYFNLTDRYEEILLEQSKASFNIVTAHPKVRINSVAVSLMLQVTCGGITRTGIFSRSVQ